MSDVTIAALTIPRLWDWGGANGTFRLTASGDFLPEGAGAVYQEGAITGDFTVTGRNVELPAITLPHTNNALDNPHVTWQMTLLDENGIERVQWPKSSFWLPASLGANTDWRTVKIANECNRWCPAPDGYPTLSQVMGLIGGASATVPLFTAALNGSVEGPTADDIAQQRVLNAANNWVNRLAPLQGQTRIVAGANADVVQFDTDRLRFARPFADLAAALAAMPTGGGTLVIDKPLALTADTVQPANISFAFTKEGRFTGLNNFKLTLNRLFDNQPRWQIFEGATPGQVLFASGWQGDVLGAWFGFNSGATAAVNTAAMAALSAALLPQSVARIDWDTGSYDLTGADDAALITLGHPATSPFVTYDLDGRNARLSDQRATGVGSVLRLWNAKFSNLANFYLSRINPSTGLPRRMGYGVDYSGPAGGGTTTTGLTTKYVNADGFAAGFHAGGTTVDPFGVGGTDAIVAVSELSWEHCIAQNGIVGFRGPTYSGTNTLNLNFRDCDAVNNTGAGVYSAIPINWYGGSMAGNNYDFYLTSTYGTSVIEGLRTESPAVLYQNSVGTVELRGVAHATPQATAWRYAIETENGQTILRGTNIMTPALVYNGRFEALTGSRMQRLYSKDTVKAAATGNIDISAPPAALDGYTHSASDRLLLAYQTNAAENGVYVSAGAGALTRAADADTVLKMSGAWYGVENGFTFGGLSFWCKTDSAGTIGTAAVSFEPHFPTLARVGDLANVAEGATYIQQGAIVYDEHPANPQGYVGTHLYTPDGVWTFRNPYIGAVNLNGWEFEFANKHQINLSDFAADGLLVSDVNIFNWNRYSIAQTSGGGSRNLTLPMPRWTGPLRVTLAYGVVFEVFNRGTVALNVNSTAVAPGALRRFEFRGHNGGGGAGWIAV